MDGIPCDQAFVKSAFNGPHPNASSVYRVDPPTVNIVVPHLLRGLTESGQAHHKDKGGGLEIWRNGARKSAPRMDPRSSQLEKCGYNSRLGFDFKYSDNYPRRAVAPIVMAWATIRVSETQTPMLNFQG